MNKKPSVGKYLDNEERELIEVIEADEYIPSLSELNPERLKLFRQAAQNTLHEGTEKVSIRLGRTDLARAKSYALREGIPYQTILKSIIHK